MIIESDTRSHITPLGQKVSNQESCKVSIALGENSKIRAFSQRTRLVQWMAEDRPVSVTFFNVLVTPEVCRSLLSVPALVKKGLAVLLVPKRALIINLNDGNKVVGTPHQDKTGFFYISDKDYSSSHDQDDGSETARNIISVAELSRTRYSTKTGSISRMDL